MTVLMPLPALHTLQVVHSAKGAANQAQAEDSAGQNYYESLVRKPWTKIRGSVIGQTLHHA